MESIINKITKILVGIIMALGVFFTIWIIMKGDEIKADNLVANQVLNPYFLITLIIFLIAAIASILFPIGQMAGKPKVALKALISIGLLVLIYIISWYFASDSTAEPFYQKFEITSSMSKFISSLINLVYVLGATAVLAIASSAVYGLISKR